MVLAVIRFHSATGVAVDQRVLSWMIAHRRPELSAVAVAITNAGSPPVVAVTAAAICAITVLVTRTPGPAAVIAATVAGAGAASTVLKLVVSAKRPPPDVQLLLETDHAFPSGHVTGTLALFGTAAAIAGHRAGAAVRTVLACAVALVVLLIASTRLYLGVHWLTDVVGGALLGAFAISLGWLLFRGWPRAEREPHETPAGDRQSTGLKAA